jgi:hypothetical protein
MFIMGDLPFIHITFAQTNQVFLDFKIANGLALMVQGQVSNPDIDPNDWYAPYVGYVESIGQIAQRNNKEEPYNWLFVAGWLSWPTVLLYWLFNEKNKSFSQISGFLRSKTCAHCKFQ